MLKLVNITKEYKVEEEVTLALNNVSIEFRKNEFVSILGPSGCGKTTLLNIVGGLDRYTDGDIQVDGISTKQYDDVDWDTYRNRRIGFVFQSYNLIPHMNILRNVAMSLTLAGIDRDERRRRALEALEKVGLADQARKKPSQLSGGQAQRVAIARALVNNPEIILADEPTGALDSESGIQVMDLLKEVAKDRLVIMVTHNPSLADEYSTRIVYLKDGQVVGDTMPYNSEEEVVEEAKEAQDVENVVTSEDANKEVAPAPQKPVKKQSKLAQKLAKIRHADKSSMKLSTAIQLSWNNLLAKKGRTLLTSIAGSIGIIGIILVLALSTGASNYIASLEESSLSSYPLTISRSNGDLTAILSTLMSNDGGEREEHPDTEAIYTNQMLGKVISELGTLMKTNNLQNLKTYIDANFDKNLARVKYNYGVNFNAFIEDPINATLTDTAEHRYMKVNPYTEVMDTVLKNLPDNLKGMQIGGMTIDEALAMFTQVGGAGMMSSWAEMPSGQDGSLNLKMLESQYELVGDESRWPQSATEVVVVVDSRNQLLDYQFFMLGLVSQDDVFKAIMDKNWANKTTSVEELLSLEYKILGDSDYLIDNGDETWTMHNHKEQNKNWIDSRDPLTIDVVGVIRPKKGVTVTSINGVLGYMPQLTDLLLEKAENHPAIQEMEARKAAAEESGETKYYGCINYAVADGHNSIKDSSGNVVDLKADYTYINFDENKDDHSTLLRQFGYADTSNPVSIEFYCYSFEAKQKIKDFIDEYNRQGVENAKLTGEEFTEISVSDGLSVIMSFVNTMATTITGVLVAFAAISLVVSTIMIAIIIYTSVLERRKEIGVLRSIGARKKDIARVFIAESAILGGYSGLIGIIISVIFSFAVSALLEFLVGIAGLMAISWWQCLMMFAISIGLSMFAGFIPSRIAANKDPAIALRSE